MKKNLYFHLGYPKTGSTTLQESVFPHLDKIKTYLPPGMQGKIDKKYDNIDWEENHQVNEIIQDFLHEKKDLSQKIKKYLIDLNKKYDSILISNVGILSAQFFKGLYTSKDSYITINKIIERIKKTFEPDFNVKIIITIRSQSEWIPSAYAEWYHYYASMKDFRTVHLFSEHFTMRDHPFTTALNYAHVINEFGKAFGKKNIHIAAFEQLKTNRKTFFTNLSTFLNSRLDQTVIDNLPQKNVRTRKDGHKQAANSLEEFLHSTKLRLLPNIRFGLRKKLPKIIKLLSAIKLPENKRNQKIILTKGEINRINSFYAIPNEEISKNYNLNLKNYNYF